MHLASCTQARPSVIRVAAHNFTQVLNRLSSTFVTALQLENSHESANRAVKALAVSRKYIKDAATGHELGKAFVCKAAQTEAH